MRFQNAIKIMLMATLLLLPSLAFAQLLGDIPDNDASVKQFLNPLFGELVQGDQWGDGADPLVELLEVFNTIVLILGGILVFYTIVGGTLSTAHDGEMLGKRWSSLWIPIRTALGAAAIMPAVGGGYAVIQAVVMWLALQGVGAGNAVWAKYLDKDPVVDAFFVPPGATRQIRESYYDMFMSSVCTAGFEEGQNLGFRVMSAGMRAAGFERMTAQVTPLVLPHVTIYTYGPMIRACGAVMLPTKGVGSPSGDPTSHWGGLNEAPAAAAALVDSDGMSEALMGVHKSHLQIAVQQLDTLAKTLVTTGLTQDAFDARIDALVDAYVTDLTNTAREQYESTREERQRNMIAGMKEDGWAMAGMYYMAIIRAQDQITRSISQTPSVSSGSMLAGVLSASGPVSGAVAKGANKALDAYIGSSERATWFQAAKDLIQGSNANTLNNVEVIGDTATGSSVIMNLVSWFVSSDGFGLTSQAFNQQGQNPIIMAKNLGQNMTTAAWIGLMGGMALQIGSTISALGTGAGPGIAIALSHPLFALFALLVVPGATLSAYVPMIPYILWLGVVLGWVILVIEAIIASPIWALAHLAPDGDGVVGRGGQGYMLIMSLVLRPPLMVLGFVCSIVLMKPLGYFINSTFMGVFAMNVNPSPFGITQMIAGCIIYVVVMVSMVHRVFTLIHVIPDRILRWIGGGGNELGEQATGMESFSAGKVIGASAAMNQIGHVTEGLGKGFLHSMMENSNKRNAQAIQHEESRARMAQVEANKGDEGHRAGLDAHRSSLRAREHGSPSNIADATMKNSAARDARLAEAETKAEHALTEAGGMELSEFRQLPEAQRQAEIDALREKNSDGSNPAAGRAADAMEFSRNLDKARQEQARDPSSNAMANFIKSTQEKVQQKGPYASGWETAASKAMEFENERRYWESVKPTKGDSQ